MKDVRLHDSDTATATLRSGASAAGAASPSSASGPAYAPEGEAGAQGVPSTAQSKSPADDRSTGESLPFRSVVLGKYELFAGLGKGGMAEVFLAVFRSGLGVNKLVVVKRLRADDAASHAKVEMFLDEARLAARMNHPNVVITYDVGSEGTELFIAMEYLEGQSLFKLQRLEKQGGPRMPAHLVAKAMADALAGLHCAHELRDFDGRPLGVVHRDVSPHNIFVTYEGRAKILDFGVAKAASSQVTQSHVIKGKIGYMAPEQAIGVPVDRRADIFAAGIVLWEMLTGRSLMTESNMVTSLMRLLNEPIAPPHEVVPDVSQALSAIVMRALSRETGQRYATAAAMREALLGWVEQTGLAAREQDVAAWMRSAFAQEIVEETHRLAAAKLAAANSAPARSANVAGTGETLRATEPPPAADRKHAWTVGLVASGLAIGLLSLAVHRAPPGALGAPAAAAVSVAQGPSREPPRPVVSARPLAALPPTTVTAVLAPSSPGSEIAPAGVPSPSASAIGKKRPPPKRGTHTPVPRAPLPAHEATPHASAAPPAPPATGFLTLDTYPWTRVTIQGKFVGTTPIVKLQLPVGTHVLSLENADSGVNQTLTVSIARGESLTKRLAYR